MAKQAKIDIIIDNAEAKRRFEELQGELLRIKKMRDEAFKKGDVGAFKVYDSELKGVNKELKQFKANVDVVENALKNINKISYKDLESAMRKARVEMQATARSASDYSTKVKNFTRLRDEMDKFNSSIGRQTSWWNKAGTGLNKYFLLLTSSIAGFTGLIYSAKKSVEEFAKLEEAESGVMKYTGKTREEVKELNEELKKFNTRTSRIELNNLMSDAGKLGIVGRQELLDFAEAGNIINLALGEDLGDGAIKNIGKLAQMFGDDQKFGLKKAMLNTGSAINEVAQKSSAAEPYLVEFTNRMAGVGKQANMSIPQIIGFASVLDQNAQAVEMSATALQGLILKLYQDPAKFAKLAGLEVQKFSNLVKKDANEALLTLLDTLGNKGGMESLAPIFKDMNLDGARATSVLAVLAGNIKKVRNEQNTATNAFYSGQSVVNEYNVKNNTLQATLDKNKKKFQETTYELGERLVPVMSSTVGFVSKLMKSIITIIDFYAKHSFAINTTVAVIGAYIVASKLQLLYLKLTATATFKQIIVTKAKAIAEEAGIIVTQLYAAAQMLLTGNIKGATQAMRVLNAVVKVNPWGLAIAGIVAIVLALRQFNKNADEASNRLNKWGEDNKVAYKNMIKLQESLMGLGSKLDNINNLINANSLVLNKNSFDLNKNTNYVQNSNVFKDEQTQLEYKRKKALDEYNAVASANNLLLLTGNENLEVYNAKLKANIFLTESRIQVGIIQSEIDDLIVKKREAQKQILRDDATAPYAKEALEIIKVQEEKLKSELKGYVDMNNAIEQEIIRTGKLAKQRKDEEDAEKNGKKINPKTGKYEDVDKNKSKDKNTKDWELNNDKYFLKAKRKLQIDYKNGVIKDEEELQDKILELEIYFLSKRKKNNKINADEKFKIEGELLDKELELKKRIEKKNLELSKEQLKKIEDNNKQALTNLKIKHNEEFASIKTLEDAKKILKGNITDKELNEIDNLYDAKMKLRKVYDKKEQQLAIELLKRLLAIYKTIQSSGMFALLEMTPEQKKQLEDDINKVKEQLAQLNADSNTSDKGEDKGGKKGDKEIKTKEVDIFGYSQDDWQTLFDNFEKGKIGIGEMAMLANSLMDVWSKYGDLVNKQQQAEVNKFVKNQNTKKTKLKQRLDQSRISEEFYNAEVAKLDEETERKKAQYAKQQAKRERDIALMSAIVNGAAAVAKVAGNLPLAIITGIAVAAQIETIIATPLPEVEGAEQGGEMLDVVRSQDKKKFNAQYSPNKRGFVNKPTIITGENGSEYIIPREGVENPSIKGILSIIENARKNGSLSKLNLDNIISVAGREQGGKIINSSKIINNYQSTKEKDIDLQVLDKLDKTLLKLDDKLSKPIEARTYLRGKFGIYEAMDEDKKLKENSYK